MLTTGLGLPDLRAEAPQQLAASKAINTAPVDLIIHIAEYIYGIRQKDLQRGFREIITTLRGCMTKRKWKALIKIFSQIYCD